jgi:fatty-acyl-CoA synthase
MLSTMQGFELTVAALFTHGRRLHGESDIVTSTDAGTRRVSFDTVARRAEQLARALQRLGVGAGDRVGTLATNTQEHLEAYLAVPGMGAVLHTLNFRLHPDQLAYVIDHAEDKVIIVEDVLVPVLAPVLPKLTTVPQLLVVGDVGGGAGALDYALDYGATVDSEAEGFVWPSVDEQAAAGLCYATGTTGDPKGVVYSHRSTVLHALVLCGSGGLGLGDRDRILPIVPMFHVNAWGLPYAGWLMGSDFVLPGRFLQAEPLCDLIEAERPTISCAIPGIWTDILRHTETREVDLSSLRAVVCAGSAVPRSLVEAFEQRHGLRIVQAWGMTETSPAGAIAWPPKGAEPEDDIEWRSRTGRLAPLVEARVVGADDEELPWDGTSVGELEVRGPWITGSYYKDPAPDRFHDGWLRTGDIGTLDPKGYIQLTDRAKDVIKSGGEWISSVELETVLLSHPQVVDAAVIGVADERWQERPLALVITDGHVEPADLREFLVGRVARWWLPERWAVVDEIPKTSVGKNDKKVLRAKHAEGGFDVQELTAPARAR